MNGVMQIWGDREDSEEGKGVGERELTSRSALVASFPAPASTALADKEMRAKIVVARIFAVRDCKSIDCVVRCCKLLLS